MDTIQEALNQKQSELDAYIQSLNDPVLKRLLEDISILKHYKQEETPKLKRLIEILGNSGNGSEPPALQSSTLELLFSDSTDGISPLTKMGFSLIGSIRDLIAQELKHDEFSQPIVFDRLIAKHPQAAPFIQRASVAATLSKLNKEKYIKETYEGHGSDPKRYKFGLNIPVNN